MVTSFKYLGRVILAAEDDWAVVVKNLSQARRVCSRISHILRREGAAPRVYGLFSKAVVHAVLLFGAENWAVKSHIDKSLGGFQTQVARRITGQVLKRTPGRR